MTPHHNIAPPTLPLSPPLTPLPPSSPPTLQPSLPQALSDPPALPLPTIAPASLQPSSPPTPLDKLDKIGRVRGGLEVGGGLRAGWSWRAAGLVIQSQTPQADRTEVLQPWSSVSAGVHIGLRGLRVEGWIEQLRLLAIELSGTGLDIKTSGLGSSRLRERTIPIPLPPQRLLLLLRLCWCYCTATCCHLLLLLLLGLLVLVLLIVLKLVLLPPLGHMLTAGGEETCLWAISRKHKDRPASLSG